MISAGELKKAIILKSPVETQNNEGGTEISYPAETILTVAKVDQVSNRRIVEAYDVSMVGAKNFYIRYAAGREAITIDWLLQYDSENYTIFEVTRLNEDKRFIRILAKVKTDG